MEALQLLKRSKYARSAEIQVHFRILVLLFRSLRRLSCHGQPSLVQLVDTRFNAFILYALFTHSGIRNRAVTRKLGWFILAYCIYSHTQHAAIIVTNFFLLIFPDCPGSSLTQARSAVLHQSFRGDVLYTPHLIPGRQRSTSRC